MATILNTDSTDNDDQQNKSVNKRGRHIQPMHEDELKKHMQNDEELARANADVLAELAAKTAELAQKVGGVEGPKERVLSLDNPEEAEPKDIFDALDEINEPAGSSLPKKSHTQNVNLAADVIREKLQRLYVTEPDAATEAAESVGTIHRSTHQQFMYELTTSGKSLAEIQTAWHEYYVDLPNDEKHVIWQEFYANQSSVSAYAKHTQQDKTPRTSIADKRVKQPVSNASQKNNQSTRRPNEIKAQLLDKINAGGRLKPIHHAKSALFGIGLAAFIGLFITFVFFNEVFIAPFVSPSQTVSATPIIGPVDGPVGLEPKIIIPKINLEVPVVYNLGTVEEQRIQDALEDGVVHYATSPEPGQIGNSVIVGHSSNNILNSGRYKFAFVLLSRLELEDTFFVHKDGVRYTYKIFEKRVVPPTEVSVLGPSSRDNTMTLITCDPPGTSINRLIIVAEQISPDPSTNTEATITVDEELDSMTLPSNAPSFWSRLTGWL